LSTSGRPDSDEAAADKLTPIPFPFEAGEATSFGVRSLVNPTASALSVSTGTSAAATVEGGTVEGGERRAANAIAPAASSRSCYDFHLFRLGGRRRADTPFDLDSKGAVAKLDLRSRSRALLSAASTSSSFVSPRGALLPKPSLLVPVYAVPPDLFVASSAALLCEATPNSRPELVRSTAAFSSSDSSSCSPAS